uniref:Uncharacterized protein n=1 Tax=Aureoumbra lagunensis TaxID=44058 RepID=A0A7S3NIA7_9STRA
MATLKRRCPEDQDNDAHLEELLQTVRKYTLRKRKQLNYLQEVDAGRRNKCKLAIINLQGRVIQGQQEHLFELAHPLSEERERLLELLSNVNLEDLETKGTEENIWPALVVARFALQGLPCPDSCRLAALFTETALIGFNTKRDKFPSELVRYVPSVLLAQAFSVNCFMWFLAILCLGILIRGEIAEYPINTPEQILNSLKEMGPRVQGTTTGK